MSPNQRLMIAVSLSVIFFVIYTTIVPPEKLKSAEANNTQNIELKQETQSENLTQNKTSVVDNATGHSIPSSQKVVQGETNTLVTVKSNDYILQIDTLGRISSNELLQEKFNNEEGQHAQLIPEFGTKPLYIKFADDRLNAQASTVAYTANVSELNLDKNSQKIILTQKLNDLVVTKVITFYADGHYDADISLSKDKRYFIYLGQRPHVSEQRMTVSGAMIHTDDDLSTIVKDGDAEGRKTFSGVEFISAFDQYSAIIMYGFKKDTNIIVERDNDSNPVVYFEAHSGMKFNGYIGQKNHKILKSLHPVLVKAIDYGWFTFASRPLFALLSWLHDMIGNWGWSIVALTLLVRLVLYPLTYKGMVSMQKMKEIAPKVKEVQAKYKGDPQRMNAAVMALYKKHGANPLGGCLPMVLQIPVFFAIYRVLLNAVELQGAPWMLWIDNLAIMDPTYVLPVLMGVSMFFQQRLTPSNFTDPMQEKIFKYLPIIFTFFFLRFQAGLVLYWFVNNLFSIAQQFVVNRQFKNAKEAEIAIAKHIGKKDD